MFTKSMVKLMCTLIVLSFTIGRAEILNVPEDYELIQDAIDASVPGEDTVLVAPGRYVEHIGINDNIVLASLFLTTGDVDYIDSTIIDGDSRGTVVTVQNCGPEEAKIIGLTITNGFGQNGGGIYCVNSVLTVSNDIITDNSCPENGLGGGIYISSRSEVRLNNLVICNNKAFGGGGICSFSSGLFMSNCQVQFNIAEAGGGGVNLVEGNEIVIENSIINGNVASHGGGIKCYQSSPKMRHTVLAENYAIEGFGGGINFSGGCKSTLRNLVLYNNYATRGGSAIFLNHLPEILLINSILWQNRHYPIYLYENNLGSLIRISNSLVGHGRGEVTTNDNGFIWWDESNKDGDPMFVDEVNWDFSLTEHSPCVDAGTAFFVWEDDTLVNLTQDDYNGLAPDMGAFESEFVNNVEDDNFILYPSAFILSAYPNPFNGQTRVAYNLASAGDVSISVFDLNGRMMEQISLTAQTAGLHEQTIDGQEWSTGLYLLKLVSSNKSTCTKIMLIK